MLENPDRVLEEVPGRPEDAQEQEPEEGGGLRAVSEIVALVSASVLVGVWLGAINPFALGMVGVVLGIGLPVLLRSVVGAREGAKRPWWRRTSGRRTSKNPHKAKFSCRLSANRASRKSVLSLCEGLLSCSSVPRP